MSAAQIKHVNTFSDTSKEDSDYTTLPLLGRQTEVPPATTPTVSSGTPLGRRGRLANLAATIGSWEDDLSHANISKKDAKEKPSVVHPKVTVKADTVTVSTNPSAAGHVVASSNASNKTTSGSNQVGLLSYLSLVNLATFFISSDLYNNFCDCQVCFEDPYRSFLLLQLELGDMG